MTRVATAFTLGSNPKRAREKMTRGIVVEPGPDKKAASTTSSSDKVKVSNPALDALGKFKADTLPVKNLAMYQVKAQMIYDRAGYK